MTKDLWINLPVKDVGRAKEFFSKLGFPFNDKMGGSTMACMMVGTKPIVVMLCADATFKGYSQHEITDTARSTEVLISFDAESPEEVREMAKKAAAAGGKVFAEPGGKDGWMYGCGFSDLDGHRWNVLHMDMSKLPK